MKKLSNKIVMFILIGGQSIFLHCTQEPDQQGAQRRPGVPSSSSNSDADSDSASSTNQDTKSDTNSTDKSIDPKKQPYSPDPTADNVDYASAWSKHMTLPGIKDANQFLRTVIDSKGTQWLVWRNRAAGQFEIWYAQRTGNSKWNKPARLIPVSRVEDLALAIGPSDVKSVVWQECDVSGPSKRIGYVEFDQEATTKPFYFTNPDHKVDAYPQIAISKNGAKYVVWAHNDKVTLASAEKGQDWKYETITNSGYTRPYIALDEVNGVIFVGYFMLAEQKLLYQSRPISGGEWSGAHELGSGKDLHIVSRNGKTLFSWGYDGTNGKKLGLSMIDNGTATLLTIPGAIPFSSFKPHSVIDSTGNAHLIWAQSTDGKNHYDIFYSDFVNNAWNPAKALEASDGDELANDLAIDLSNDQIYAVFLSKSSETTIISTERSLESDK